eukprot:COSAG06_NODE_1710_length_8634_cov_767.811365_4_plen_101_part_00
MLYVFLLCCLLISGNFGDLISVLCRLYFVAFLSVLFAQENAFCDHSAFKAAAEATATSAEARSRTRCAAVGFCCWLLAAAPYACSLTTGQPLGLTSQTAL